MRPRRRSDQKFCSDPACQLRSKNGKFAVNNEFDCPHCGDHVRPRNSRQVTCGKDACKRARLSDVQRRNRRNSRDWEEDFNCDYCGRPAKRKYGLQITCGSSDCQKRRRLETTLETFNLKRKMNPLFCPVCEEPIRVKRFKYHPECRRQLINDKRRIKRLQQKIEAERVARQTKQRMEV